MILMISRSAKKGMSMANDKVAVSLTSERSSTRWWRITEATAQGQDP